jgi:phenylalanyl-tRNA synthetase beta subunit
MAQEVRLREEKLKEEVTELKIALDETRQKRKVAEITEPQYFKDIQHEADLLRNIISGKNEAGAE